MITNKGTKEMRLIYDPIQIKILERQLKRPLDEMERAGEKSVWINGRLTFLRIEQVVFPYDLMPSKFTTTKDVKDIRSGVAFEDSEDKFKGAKMYHNKNFKNNGNY